MKTTALLLWLAGSTAFAQVTGTWAAEERNGKLQLQLRYARNQHSNSVSLDQFTGLSRSVIDAEGTHPVLFQMVRDAGTLSFEGTFEDGLGAGHFRFTPATGYISDLRASGVRISEDYSDVRLLSLAIFDISRAFVRELQTLGYEKLDIDDLVAMRIHGVTPAFIRELSDAGYRNVEIDDLVALRIHGATPEYIREMASHGFRPALDDLLAMRIHGVSPELVRELRAYGYATLDADDVVAMRIHGVTPQFIRELRSLGYTGIDADDLVSMRIHGVTPEFIRELRDAGLENVPVDKLIQLKIHGIDREFVRALKKRDRG